MFVEVPRYGGRGGDVVKKVVKQSPMELNNAIKIELGIKLLEYVSMTWINKKDEFFCELF
jgi:hypothetical protein